MVATKRRVRRDWSRQDLRYLKTTARRTSVRQIARKLRRSERAVRQKAFAVGISLDTRKQVDAGDKVKNLPVSSVGFRSGG